jgi:hypothetical protein
MMPSRFVRIAALFAGLLLAAPAFAEDAPIKEVESYLKANVISWLSDKTVVDAIKAQNTKNAGLTQAVRRCDARQRAHDAAPGGLYDHGAHPAAQPN